LQLAGHLLLLALKKGQLGFPAQKTISVALF